MTNQNIKPVTVRTFQKFKENPRIKTKLAQAYFEIGNDDMAYQFDPDYVIKMRKS